MIEYTRGKQHPAFGKLTALLHCKQDSPLVKQKDLDAIFNNIFGKNDDSYSDDTSSVVAMIDVSADACLNPHMSTSVLEFENKIVLSIAIRLVAERYMVKMIDDVGFTFDIDSNQTYELQKRFQNEFPEELAAIEVIKRVVLMTPENIHLNSFMYEPILDMSDEHLKQLYQEVKKLC